MRGQGRLQGKVAIVTGGAQGQGAAIVRAFVAEGAQVVIADIADPVGESLAAELGEPALFRHHDVADPASWAGLVEVTAEAFGPVSVLVNNAGILPEATEGTDAAFVDHGVLARTLQTNVLGAASVIDAFLPLLLRSEAGRVLNVSSTMGSLSDQEDPASPYYDALVPAYRASKAALNSLTIGLARTLEGTTVTALAVCPGFMQTELTPANAEQAPLTAQESAAFLVEAADADRSSGSFVDRDGVVAW